MMLGIFYFTPRTRPDIPTNVYYVYFIGHVNLALMHIIKHVLFPFSPNFVIATVTEKANTDNDVSCKSKSFLHF